MAPPIWTIGHSTRSIEEFVDALGASGIQTLVDVRRYPGSRRHQQFNREVLAAALKKAGIEYVWRADLGGRRPVRDDSRNSAWRNKSFRGYADYMETPAFQKAVDDVRTLASTNRVAIMCSEYVWWRCHRGLIADYLKARGVTVIHIFDAGKAEEHPYTSAARIVEGQLDYGTGDA